MTRPPNVVFVFADQWRRHACGFWGNQDIYTPCLDRFAGESVNVVNAVSSVPVCSPYRASLLSGQRALTHGVFLNDVPWEPRGVTLGEAFARAGYATGYVGKWHVDGHGRDSYIPPERRRGFSYWKVRECTHNYWHSMYYDGNDPERKFWEGYDAYSQTEAAIDFIRRQQSEPFFLILSWGPPHNPYETAPPEWQAYYAQRGITLPPNVPSSVAEQSMAQLRGYYAHCSALDASFGRLLEAIEEQGIADDTIVVFTSDHGDMLGAHGLQRKQWPHAESIRVPFLLRYPRLLGRERKEVPAFLDACDVMPTLLGLAGLPIPAGVEGRDVSGFIAGREPDPTNGRALIACYHPFGEFARRRGGREYRGIVTSEYTYVETLDGPWLLFDDRNDPFQLHNLVHDPEAGAVRHRLSRELKMLLDQTNDSFLPGMEYVRQWGYEVNADETVPCPSRTG